MMTQAQFAVLDALICSRIGKSDETELTVWAALAVGLAQSLSLTVSPTLQTLAAQVWS